MGEGALLTLDSNPVALYPLENSIYISAGKDQWYNTIFTISSGNDKEDSHGGRGYDKPGHIGEGDKKNRFIQRIRHGRG